MRQSVKIVGWVSVGCGLLIIPGSLQFCDIWINLHHWPELLVPKCAVYIANLTVKLVSLQVTRNVKRLLNMELMVNLNFFAERPYINPVCLPNQGEDETNTGNIYSFFPLFHFLEVEPVCVQSPRSAFPSIWICECSTSRC